MRKIFPLVVVFLFCCGLASGQIPHSMTETVNLRLGGNIYIAGTVYWPNGQPVNTRINIRLRTIASGEHITSTDTNGQFIFGGLPEGRYTVVIDSEKEFETVQQDVEIHRGGGGGPKPVFNVTIRLREKSVNLSAKPIVTSVDDAVMPKEARLAFDKALELSKGKDHTAAIAQLRKAIGLYPKFANAYNEIAVQYQKLGQLDKADEALLDALTIKPGAFEPTMNRGIVLFRMNRFSEAASWLENLIKAHEGQPLPYFYLGRTMIKLQKPTEAEVHFLKALSIGGDEMKEAHRMLASIYLDRDDRPKAAAALENYIRLAPNVADLAQLKDALAQVKAAIGKP